MKLDEFQGCGTSQPPRAPEPSVSSLPELSELCTDAVVHLDSQGLIRGCNQRFLRLLRTDREVVGTRFQDWVVEPYLPTPVTLDPFPELGSVLGLVGPESFVPVFSRSLEGSQGRPEGELRFLHPLAYPCEGDRTGLEGLVQAAVGRLLRGLAHEMNNQLGIILGHAELLGDGSDIASDVKNSAANILRAVDRCESLLLDVALLGRGAEDGSGVLDLSRTLSSLASLQRRVLGAEGIRFEATVACDLPVPTSLAGTARVVLLLLQRIREDLLRAGAGSIRMVASRHGSRAARILLEGSLVRPAAADSLEPRLHPWAASAEVAARFLSGRAAIAVEAHRHPAGLAFELQVMSVSG